MRTSWREAWPKNRVDEVEVGLGKLVLSCNPPSHRCATYASWVRDNIEKESICSVSNRWAMPSDATFSPCQTMSIRSETFNVCVWESPSSLVSWVIVFVWVWSTHYLHCVGRVKNHFGKWDPCSSYAYKTIKANGRQRYFATFYEIFWKIVSRNCFMKHIYLE